MPKKFIYLILILLVVIALILFLVGWQLGKLSAGKFYQEHLNQKQTEIKALQSALEMFYPPLPEEIFGISGKVAEIKNKTIFIEAAVQVSRFPLPGGAEIEKQNIKVIVTDQTKITEFNPLAPPPLLGEEISEKILKFSDIKIGDTISVSSAENIKGKKEITASQIQVIKEAL